MTKRRGWGEGSIYQRKDGLYAAQVELGHQEGGKRNRKFLYSKDKKVLLAKLRNLEHSLSLNLPLPDERQLTQIYLQWWISNVLAGTVGPKTEDNYAYTLKQYVIPYIGQIKLAKLSSQNIQTMMRQLEKRNLSARTRQNARVVLGRALRYAERSGLTTRNVAYLVDSPKVVSKKADPLNEERAIKVLAAVKDHPIGAVVTTVLATGMRRGEALALRWEDVKLDVGELVVTGSLQRISGKGLKRLEPKTEKSRRTLLIPAFVVSELREHRQRQLKLRLAAGPIWQDTGYVFTTPIGTPMDPDHVSKAYMERCKAAGLGHLCFKDLRHSNATLLLGNGIPLETISKALGHSTYQMTADVYAHVQRPAFERAAAVMESVMGSGA